MKRVGDQVKMIGGQRDGEMATVIARECGRIACKLNMPCWIAVRFADGREFGLPEDRCELVTHRLRLIDGGKK